MKLPLVTTIITTFNRAQMLQRAIRSVQAQTLDALEILVLDDAGTDGTQAMMRQLAAEDPRITYVRHRKNVGIVSNFGDGLSRVATPYCSFLSDDDYLLPDFYQTCLAVLESDRDLALASGGLILIHEDGSTLSTLDKWHEFGRLIPAQSVGRLLSNMTAAWSSALIRTQAAKEFGLDDRLAIAFDMLLMLQLSSKYPTWLFAQPFAIQRIDKATISGAAPPRELIREWQTLEEIFSREIAPVLAGQADGIAAQVTAGVVRMRRYLELEERPPT